MKTSLRRSLPVFLIAILLTSLGVPPARAQGSSHTFPETGKTVAGRFLEYWTANGGLVQQGYPISDEMQEKSDTDGKIYTVQYFERAVFELHPENAAPYDVLLSLLGARAYKVRYPSGAPGQTPNNVEGSVLFPETGKRLGGRFLQYWQQNGGLAQQGYPISDEFDEVSPLNGRTYRVQYFERAVFELHPENTAPYDVLLSQLGTLQYRVKYLQTPTPAAPTATPTDTPVPTNTPAPPPSPTVNIYTCEGVPPSDYHIEIVPNCIHLFDKLSITGVDWVEDDYVNVWATMPNGQVLGAPFNVPVSNRGSGRTAKVTLHVDDETPFFGLWIITMRGNNSGREVYGYFKMVPAEVPLP